MELLFKEMNLQNAIKLPEFVSQQQREFSTEENKTWNTILENHSKTREDQIIDLFHNGIKTLNISSDHIPNINEINETLRTLSGFQGIFVDGLEGGHSFYTMLSRRQFPIGNFIRDKQDLTYTPEPDVVHDLYGHIPFFCDKDYSDFCQRFGELACEFLDDEKLLRQFERFFWFTVEFGLIKTPKGVRVFGAGIASSTGECEYALSDKPEILPFDVDTIRKQEFRIDIMQTKLFLIESKEQLYASLDELYEKVKSERKK